MATDNSVRAMKKEDWIALYVVQRLEEQIVLFGASALDAFVDAWSEASATDRCADPTASPEGEQTR